MSGLKRILPVAVLLLVAGLLVSSQALSAQPGGRDRTFVGAPDGSIWVIVDGMRHRIETAPIGNGELSGVAEGPPVQTVDQLVALVGEPSTSTMVSPGGAPATSSLPATLLGQTPTVCQDGVPIGVRVIEADWADAPDSGASSRWVLAVVSATNRGQGGASLYDSTQLRDERGRTWTDIAGTASAPHIDYAALARQRGAQLANDILSPGRDTRVLLVYGVAADAKQLELVSLDGGC